MQVTVAPATYLAAGGTVFMGLNVQEWGIVGVIVGIVFTVLTYATTFYFKRRNK